MESPRRGLAGNPLFTFIVRGCEVIFFDDAFAIE
jgi:hypothetical protein